MGLAPYFTVHIVTRVDLDLDLELISDIACDVTHVYLLTTRNTIAFHKSFRVVVQSAEKRYFNRRSHFGVSDVDMLCIYRVSQIIVVVMPTHVLSV